MIRYVLVKRNESASLFEVRKERHWLFFKSSLITCYKTTDTIIWGINTCDAKYYIINKHGDYVLVSTKGDSELKCMSNYHYYVDNIKMLPLL